MEVERFPSVHQLSKLLISCFTQKLEMPIRLFRYSYPALQETQVKYYLRKGTISIAFFIAALARFFLISYRADCFDAIAFFLFYYLCRSTNSRASLAA
jgi:hypothetical protein